MKHQFLYRKSGACINPKHIVRFEKDNYYIDLRVASKDGLWTNSYSIQLYNSYTGFPCSFNWVNHIGTKTEDESILKGIDSILADLDIKMNDYNLKEAAIAKHFYNIVFAYKKNLNQLSLF
jgi:hypothetical protein